MNVNDLHWAAGFIDGEGSFTRCGGTISVSASQNDKWHIEKLYALFKGNTNIFSHKLIKGNDGVYHRWSVYGPRAAGVMMTLYSLLSPRRQAKISELLAAWLKQPGFHKPYKIHCKHGHPMAEDNLYISKKGKRECRACALISRRKYVERKKLTINQ